jgi:hypothetical protein
MTKYFVDAQGNFLGGFDGAEPPIDAAEVPNAPVNGLDKFINGAWVPDATRVQQEAIRVADNVAVNTAKANANLLLLAGATPAQISAFCTSKFPTLTAPERATIADILLGLQIVVKSYLR